MNWNNIFNENITELNKEELKFYNAIQNEDTNLFELLLCNNENEFLNFLNNAPENKASFLSRIISSCNIKYFEESSQPFIKNISYSFYSQKENKLNGTLNLNTNAITLEDKTINSSLNERDSQLDEELLNDINLAISLGIEEIPVQINLEEKVLITKETKRNIINSSLIVSSLFLSLSSFAQEQKVYDSGDLVSHTLDAIKDVEQVKEYIQEKKEEIDRKTKQFVDSIENKEIAGAVGLATKIAVERKIAHKGKLDCSDIGLSELGLGKLDYAVEVNMDGSIRGGIGGDNPFIKNSSYKFIAETGSETKIKFDLNIKFD